MKMMKTKEDLIFIIAIAIAITGAFILGGYAGKQKVVNKLYVKAPADNTIDCDTIDYSTFSKENLKKFIKIIGIQHPDIVYAQAVLESGNFRSELFLKKHNLFGMKIPSSRRTLSITKQGTYSDYSSNRLQGWQLSVIDYALWQDKYGFFSTREQYLDYLSSAYAEDPKYVRKLLQIVSENY